MRSGHRKGFLFSAGVAMASVMSVSLASAAVLVDDFSGTLSPYQYSKVLDNNTATDTSFAISGTGDLHSSYAGAAGAAEQALLLRNDFSLPVGSSLYADVTGFAAGTNFDRDLGIAVAFTKTPASLANGVGGDVRANYIEVSVRGNNQIVSFARDGATNLASGQNFTGQNTLTATDPLGIYITHTGANTFDFGFYQNGATHSLLTNGGTYTFTGGSTPGAAIGIYTDLRATLGTTPVGLDNLQILTGAVPEPSSLALLGLSGIAALRRRRATNA